MSLVVPPTLAVLPCSRTSRGTEGASNGKHAMLAAPYKQSSAGKRVRRQGTVRGPAGYRLRPSGGLKSHCTHPSPRFSLRRTRALGLNEITTQSRARHRWGAVAPWRRNSQSTRNRQRVGARGVDSSADFFSRKTDSYRFVYASPTLPNLSEASDTLSEPLCTPLSSHLQRGHPACTGTPALGEYRWKLLCYSAPRWRYASSGRSAAASIDTTRAQHASSAMRRGRERGRRRALGRAAALRPQMRAAEHEEGGVERSVFRGEDAVLVTPAKEGSARKSRPLSRGSMMVDTVSSLTSGDCRVAVRLASSRCHQITFERFDNPNLVRWP